MANRYVISDTDRDARQPALTLTLTLTPALTLKVCGIIDHHQDERQHLDTCGDVRPWFEGGTRRIDTSP